MCVLCNQTSHKCVMKMCIKRCIKMCIKPVFGVFRTLYQKKCGKLSRILNPENAYIKLYSTILQWEKSKLDCNQTATEQKMVTKHSLCRKVVVKTLFFIIRFFLLKHHLGQIESSKIIFYTYFFNFYFSLIF